ncbi:MAG TPA: hypothetical protein VFV05_16440 [Methylomirabilota bacterium]|nr:hypothetical protein [Methylomirabilota bacterium]
MFELYDEYCHGRIDRREFLQRASVLTIGGVSALAMARALLPRYALAQTISFTDQRIKARYVTYPSPGGSSRGRGSPRHDRGLPGPRSRRLVARRRVPGQTTATAAPSRPASTRPSCARTWSTARDS